MTKHIQQSIPMLTLLAIVAMFGLGLTLLAKSSISKDKVTLDSHPVQLP